MANLSRATLYTVVSPGNDCCQGLGAEAGIMQRIIGWGAVTVAAFTALAAPACAQEDNPRADAITLGMEAPAGSFSLDEENLGFRLAFQERNARGTIHGRKIAWNEYARPAGAG